MRIRTALLATVAFSMILGSTGCRTSDAEPSGSACPSQVFDLNDRTEPLGPPDELIRAFNGAADRQLGSTTMAEMINEAGWSPAWDRIIYISAGMTDEELRESSDADLRVPCFTGWPPDSSNSDLRRPYATLFLLDGKPVQSVLWTGQNPTLEFGSAEFLTPGTIFRYDSSSRVMVAE